MSTKKKNNNDSASLAARLKAIAEKHTIKGSVRTKIKHEQSGQSFKLVGKLKTLTLEGVKELVRGQDTEKGVGYSEKLGEVCGLTLSENRKITPEGAEEMIDLLATPE